MRTASLVLLLLAIVLPFAAGQTIIDKTLESQLKRVFPNATTFSPKQAGPVPHYVAYTGAPGSQTIAGYAFWTTELEPLERGYDGPIKILVGLDLSAHLTGVLVTENHEPYGYFSVDLPEFAQQFRVKTFAILSRSAAMLLLSRAHRSPLPALPARLESAPDASRARC